VDWHVLVCVNGTGADGGRGGEVTLATLPRTYGGFVTPSRRPEMCNEMDCLFDSNYRGF
jgi:hypothetical protein